MLQGSIFNITRQHRKTNLIVYISLYMVMILTNEFIVLPFIRDFLIEVHLVKNGQMYNLLSLFFF